MSPKPKSEQEIADSLASYLDARAAGLAGAAVPLEAADEGEMLAEIDRVLDIGQPGVPERLSGHKILNVLGSGGMGVVFLARDERLGRDVAIKTLSPRFANEPALTARFMHEARTMAQITHPNIARIYSLGGPEEPAHFVMEFLKGAPLTIAAEKLSFHQRAELMYKVANAVAFLHHHGVVHRDLKPDNVLVGPDFEPKLLDFGLALDAADPLRLSQTGEIVGTPLYVSPEQTRGSSVDARSDVFSLGVLLYQLLTGHAPFGGGTLGELVRHIQEDDPVLPTRRNPSVPRDLQNICLSALEKAPERRYQSAAAMAEDLQRFLAGEAVMAEPEAYSRLIGGQIAQHVRDLESWRRDGIVSDSEYDGLRRRYERLTDREDAWIMETRRLTLPQVTLYLGKWVLCASVALLALFRFPDLGRLPAILMALASIVPTAWIGIDSWNRGRLRVGLAFLLGASILTPMTAAVILGEFGLAAGLTQNREDLELFSKLGMSRRTTNAQIWWSLLLAIPASVWLRRFTRASVFTLAAASCFAFFWLATLMRMGAIEWLEKDPGKFYFHLLPAAGVFMAAGFWLETRRRFDDSRYIYPFAVAFTWTALTGAATYHEPYAAWLRWAAPWTRGQLEYLFIINAAIYLTLSVLCDRMASPQLRMVGTAFRFVLPGHILTSLLLLGISAKDAKLLFEARFFEWLLPGAACVFVFGSIPRQMKNFFASGLLFLAIGIVRLQQNAFKDRAIWPMLLMMTGLGLMLAAARYAPLRVALRRLLPWREKITDMVQ